MRVRRLGVLSEVPHGQGGGGQGGKWGHWERGALQQQRGQQAPRVGGCVWGWGGVMQGGCSGVCVVGGVCLTAGVCMAREQVLQQGAEGGLL